MVSLQRLVVIGIAVVLVFDTVASLASLSFGFPYQNATIGSMVIYCALGYFAFRLGGIAAVLKAAILVELVEVFVGWPISWFMGPGALPEGQRTPAVMAASVVVIFLLALFSALGGAGLARLFHGPRGAPGVS